MQFFDDKQEVMDVVITPFGKHLMSKGRFKPAYYAFFDDDILYDSQWISGSSTTVVEAQNSIEPRIQDETPRIKQPSVYTGVETAITQRNEIIREAISNMPYASGSYVAQDTHNHKIYNQETLQFYGDKHQFMSKPLGRSSITSKYAPAWNISMLQGEVSSSQDYLSPPTGSIELIPQINITLNYKLYVDNIGNEQEWAAENITVDHAGETFTIPSSVQELQTEGISGLIPTDVYDNIDSEVFPDGTYLTLQSGKIILEVVEKNVDYKKENFDIQVFATGSLFEEINSEQQQLFFSNVVGVNQEDEVEKYLTIRVDREIDHPSVMQRRQRALTALASDRSTGKVISTREFMVRDLYEPEEDICE